MTDYWPNDQREHLGEPPWDWDSYEMTKWEEAHGHDPRSKCIPEYGCLINTMDHAPVISGGWWCGASPEPDYSTMHIVSSFTCKSVQCPGPHREILIGQLIE